MRLKQLVEHLGPVKIDGPMSREVLGITADSRHVTPGMLYVALPGSASDTWKSISAAVDRGAVAVVSEQESITSNKRTKTAAIQVRSAHTALARVASSWYSHPSKRLEIIGVVGKQGRTEAATILKRLLMKLGRKTALLKSDRLEVGERSFPMREDQWEAIEIQRLLAQMLKLDCTTCVIELGENPVAQAASFGIRLTKLISMEALPTSEFEALLQSNPQAELIAPDHLINDTLRLHLNVRSYGLGRGHFRADRLQCSRRGAAFRLQAGERGSDCTLDCLGYERVFQLLAAVAAIQPVEGEVATIARVAREITQIAGHMHKAAERDGYQVFVDGARDAAELQMTLQAARRFTTGRIILVAAATGTDSAQARESLGKAAAEGADLTFITSNDPGLERPEIIAEMVRRGYLNVKVEGVTVELDRARAIETAIRAARSGDLVLITGKGSKAQQKLADTIVPFDDAEVARKLVQYHELVLPKREITPFIARDRELVMA